MPKKGSPKTPSKKENTIVEEEKRTSNSKELGKEIDEIFAGKKRKNPELKKDNRDGKGKLMNKEKKSKKKKKNKGDAEDGFADLPARPPQKTEDGFVIYTEEELGINKANAGGTPLCPFDCDCCF